MKYDEEHWEKLQLSTLAGRIGFYLGRAIAYLMVTLPGLIAGLAMSALYGFWIGKSKSAVFLLALAAFLLAVIVYWRLWKRRAESGNES